MNPHAWALIDAFAEAGVTDVVTSPGSRSTPFVLAAATHPGLRVHDVLDERAAAFFALGMGRATGRPALVLCTSGSAGAHHYPAVVEAAAAFVPLLVLTADRPPELQRCGAAQTIDQTRLFGEHVRRFFAVPEEPRAARRVAVQALALARHPVPGPVHLNAHARKPLEAAPERAWPPLPRIYPPRSMPDPDAVEELARACLGARRGLVVCGPLPVGQPPVPLHALGFPVVAEAASQHRRGAILDAYEWIDLPDAPDLVLQIGAAPTSTRLDGVARAVVSAHGDSDARLHVEGDPAATLAALAARLPPREPTAWAAALAAANARARAVVAEESGGWSEALAARIAARSARGLLAVGNSLPIRLLDRYVTEIDAPVLSQRGASGIDGLVAGAAGAAIASGRPTTLLLGDVSFLHDLDGLLAAREAPLTIVVLHNDGGRLFEQLPIAAHAGQLRHFTTPHGLDLRPAAELARLSYAEVQDGAALETALAAGTRVICARVDGAAELQRRIERRLRCS